MSETQDDAATPRMAETFAEVEDALLSRWPETRLEPTLERIEALVTEPGPAGDPGAGPDEPQAPSATG